MASAVRMVLLRAGSAAAAKMNCNSRASGCSNTLRSPCTTLGMPKLARARWQSNASRLVRVRTAMSFGLSFRPSRVDSEPSSARMSSATRAGRSR